MRRKTPTVKVGSISVGSDHPIVVQSMTNTDTSHIESTANQIIDLAKAGSELVRITVNNETAARAVPSIIELLDKQNTKVPLVGDFHYNGHLLLTRFPECAKFLAKYRINPGNVGSKTRDKNFTTIIELAIKYQKPVRIGVNWGSLDKQILTELMDQNSQSSHPLSTCDVTIKAMVESALRSAELAEQIGLGHDRIILSVKVSGVQDLIQVYRQLAVICNYPLHLGLTEAGMGTKGIVSSASGLAILLQEGIGDTIRVSLTPQPGGDRREEVYVAQQILQSLELRSFLPQVTACPGCGRTTSTVFQKLAKDINAYIISQMPVWREKYPGVEDLKVAVMGCVVNGPGESKHANIGISLPGTGEDPKAPVYIDGKHAVTLQGDDIAGTFQSMLEEYIRKKYSV